MKSLTGKIRLFHGKASLNLLSVREFETCAITTPNSGGALTTDEVNQIKVIIPRLCASNHFKEATNLMAVALSTSNPPLTTLPLSSFIRNLSLQPDLTHPMHLLNTLKHNPNTGNPNFLLPIAKMLVSSFFRHGCPRKAVKVFQWVARPDFPGGVAVDLEFYAALVDGFCRNRMVLDSLRVLRTMVSENFEIGSEVKMWIYKGLLKEARVREALQLNAALNSGTPGSDGTFGSKEVVDLLDRMIATWVD